MLWLKAYFTAVGFAATLLSALVVAPAYAAPAAAEAPRSDAAKSTSPLADEDTTGSAQKSDADDRAKALGCSQPDAKKPGSGCEKGK